MGVLLAFFSQYARSGTPCWRIRFDDDRRECGFVAGNFHAGFFGYELKQDFSFNSIMVVLFLGIFSTGLSVLLWLHGAKSLGETTAGLHQNLVPIFVMLIMFILGEGFQWREGVGGLLVISGAIIAQLRKREST